MIKIFSMFFVINFIFGCFSEYSGTMPFYSKHELIADDITAQVAKTLSKRYTLQPVGFGGSIHETVEKMSLSFNCNKQMTINEYRALIVDCAEYYLAQINSYEELKPHLQCYPFIARNIDLCIFIYQSNGERVNLGQIQCVHLINGGIDYSIRDSDYTTKLKHGESFEEAKQIVAEQKGGSDTL